MFYSERLQWRRNVFCILLYAFIIGRPGDDISSTSYSMSHTLSTGPFGSTSLVTTTAGNGIPFGAVPFLLWSLFLLIG